MLIHWSWQNLYC